MKTMYVIIAIALVIVTWVIIRIRNQRRNSLSKQVDELTKHPTFRTLQQLQDAMGINETQDGKVPDGYGKFGYDATNPIPVKGVTGEIAYLARLRTEKGVKVEYKRLGHTTAESINHPIDRYEINEDGEYICILYLCPYFREISDVTPKGFELFK